MRATVWGLLPNLAWIRKSFRQCLSFQKKNVKADDKNDGEWNKVGDLKVPRRGHGAIYSSGKFLIVGGFGYDKTYSTEVCEWNKPDIEQVKARKIKCKRTQPNLWGYWYTPELVLVPNNFCSNKTIAD